MRQELDNFRNENITLYNELTKQNKTLCEELLAIRQENLALKEEMMRQHMALEQRILYVNATPDFDSLEKYQNRLAAMQTAEFVTDNMSKVTVFKFTSKHPTYFDFKAEYLRHVISQIDSDLKQKPSLYLEFGVAGGWSINIISATLPDKIIYGFDSFEGLPEDWHGNYLKGYFDLKGKLPKVNDNVQLVRGFFNETLPAFLKDHPQKCAFIHVDCDIYSSAKTVFGLLKDRIVSGTVIEFDEYFNYPGWQNGEYKAFMEFLTETGLEFEYIARTDYCQVAVKIK